MDRAYSLEGRGMELLEEKEAREAMETEKTLIREVETKYQIVRDRVVEHYIRLEEMAHERGFKPGWVYYQMKELGIDPPRAMESKYASTCKHCRRKVSPRNGNTPGETILWAGTGNVFHRDCFFASLGNAQLEQAYIKLEYQAAQ